MESTVRIKRKEILWEHMGLMGDPEYCRRALKKEEMYIKNGYRTGIDIIYTRESSGYTISTKVIDQIIKEFFYDCGKENEIGEVGKSLKKNYGKKEEKTRI